MLMVQKYGGTSLGDTEKIRSAAKRAAQLEKEGHKLVIVVSAQGDTTDLMIEKAASINKRRAAREMDAYLAAGEQMSAGLLAMALGALGCSAVSLTGWQAGIHTDGVHGNAKILEIDTTRICKELDAGKIVVVSGFQGVDEDCDITPWAGAVPIPRRGHWLRTCRRRNARSLRMWTGSTTGIPGFFRMPGGLSGSAMKK